MSADTSVSIIGDKRAWRLKNLTEAWMNSSLNFNEQLFKKILDSTSVFRSSNFAGVNVTPIYFLASKCEEYGNKKKFKLCLDKIKEIDRTYYSSSECLKWIHDNLEEKTLHSCIIHSLKYFKNKTLIVNPSLNDRSARLVAEKIALKNLEVSFKFLDLIQTIEEKLFGLINISRALINSQPSIAEDLLFKALIICVEEGIDRSNFYCSIIRNLYTVRDNSIEILHYLKRIGENIFECLPILIHDLSKYKKKDGTAERLWGSIVEADAYISSQAKEFGFHGD